MFWQEAKLLKSKIEFSIIKRLDYNIENISRTI